MQPSDLDALLSGAHAACDAAWAKVGAASAALLAPHDEADHARRWQAWVGARDAHDAAVQRLAALTAQAMAAVMEARDAA